MKSSGKQIILKLFLTITGVDGWLPKLVSLYFDGLDILRNYMTTNSHWSITSRMLVCWILVQVSWHVVAE